MKLKPKSIALLVAVLLCLILLIQNAEAVSFRFFFWRLSMSGIIFFPLLLILGFIAGWLAGRILSKPHKATPKIDDEKA